MLSARTTLSGAIERSSVSDATCPMRMHAGIGASGARDRDRRAIELRAGVLEQPLDRHAAGLPLPADQAGAVVGDGQLEVHLMAYDSGSGLNGLSLES